MATTGFVAYSILIAPQKMDLAFATVLLDRPKHRSPFYLSIPKTNTDNRNPTAMSVAEVQMSTFDLIYSCKEI